MLDPFRGCIGFSRLPDQGDGILHLLRNINKLGDYQRSSERLVICKANRKRRLEFYLLLAFRCRSSLLSTDVGVSEFRKNAILHVCEINEPVPNDKGPSWIKFPHIIPANFDGVPDRDDEFMLVMNIQTMKAVKERIAASVWFKLIDCSLDVFSGNVYLSLAENRFKGLSILPEWELNVIRAAGFPADNLENSDVQSGSQIVHRITNDQAKFVWDGFLDFDADDTFCRLWVEPADEFKRIFAQELGDPCVEAVDVMLGPFNLKSGAAK